MKLNWTKVAVALFVAVLISALHCERVRAQEDGPVLSLGTTVLNSHSSVGELGYRLERWEVAATLIGHGRTSRGDTENRWAGSVSRIVRPGWRLAGGENYYRIGVAHVDGHPLVGSWNYRLGAGMRWGVVELEYFHYSSAGINDVNTGIDGVQLRLRL